VTKCDLFIRYMKAFEESTSHVRACTPACESGTWCQDGAVIHQLFFDLQDEYEASQGRPPLT
jgi:hypothetical protein